MPRAVDGGGVGVPDGLQGRVLVAHLDVDADRADGHGQPHALRACSTALVTSSLTSRTAVSQTVSATSN